MDPTPTTIDQNEPVVYSLDRRGPNDPVIGSVHVVVAILTSVLVAAAVALL